MKESEALWQAIAAIWSDLPQLLGNEWQSFAHTLQYLLNQLTTANDTAEQIICDKIFDHFYGHSAANARLHDALIQEGVQQAHNTRSGSIDSSKGATAAGKRGVAASGNVFNSIIVTGNGSLIGQIETDGGTYVQGNVYGGRDFVGRDQVNELTTVTRYTDIDLPAQVQVAQRFPLIVGLTVAPSLDSADAQLLEAPLGAEIQCAITPGPNLVVLGDRIKPLTVGTGDSEPALFYLRATAVGDWQVTIDFWHEGQIRASSTHLIRAVDETVTMQTSHRAGPPLFGSPEKAPYPDLVIRITTLQNQLRYDLTFGDLSFQSFIGEPLRSDPEQYRYNLLQEIEALNSGTAEDEETVLDRLTAIGQREYKTLWPPALRQAYRRFRNQIRTLQIISDEPWIPWELLKPYDDEEPAALIDDDFLALQFDFARWFTPALAPAASIVIDSLACIAPTDSGLPAAQQELALLQRLAGERQWTDYTPAVPDRATVRQLLRDQAPIHLWHFACHGDFDATTPGQSPLLLQGASGMRMDRAEHSVRHLTPVDAAGASAGRGGTRRAQLRPDDLVGPVQTRLKRDRPFVFLNACRVGSGGMELTGVGGWAKVLVADCGVGALLAPLWTINDAQAHEFAALFYQALQDDETTVAAATRTARKALQQRYPNDPLWLAYSLYAHPNARVGPAG